MNLSFAGCGFLGIYHVGVASCFRKYAPHLLLNKISGASAGAIAACCLLLDLPLGETTSDILKVAIEARKSSLGPFHPSFDVNKLVMEGLEKFLPEDAHIRVSGKLHISLTRCRDGKNVMVSQFDSREELIQALLASAFIPIFSGILPPKFRGVRYMDGGYSDNLPTLDENTITVSPFCGESDICPRDDSSQLFHINIANTSIELSKHNIYRMVRILFPPKPEVLANMCKQGFDDALRFLHRNNLINCTKCLAVQSTFVVSETLEEHLVYDPQCSDCKVQRQEALVSNVPDTVLNVFQEVIDSANKGLLNWLFKHRGMKLLSVLSLPYTLPANVMYTTLTKIGLLARNPTPLKRMLVYRKHTKFQLYSLFGPEFDMHFFKHVPCKSFILPHAHRAYCYTSRRHSESSVDNFDVNGRAQSGLLALEGTSKDDSTLVATAPTVSSTIWELSRSVLDNVSHILHRVNKQTQQLSARFINCELDITEYGGDTFDIENRQDLAEKIKFTVNLDNCDLPLDRSPERKFKTKQILKRNSSFTLKKTDTLDDDTFDHILQVTSQQDAVMTYYYLDENNKVKVTEIYDVTDSDSPIVQTPQEQSVNTQLQFDECFGDDLSQIDESMHTDYQHSEYSLEDMLEKDPIFSDPESEWGTQNAYTVEHPEDELNYDTENVKSDIMADVTLANDTRPESDQPNTSSHITIPMTF